MTNLGISPAWTIAWIVTGSIFAVAALASLIALTLHFLVWRKNARNKARWDADYKDRPRYSYYPDSSEGAPVWWVTAVIAAGIGLLVAIAQVLMMIPYDAKYWSWYEVTGTVEEITNRTLVLGEDDITQDFIVHVTGSDLPLRMNDPRITSLEGETVTLLCGVSWESYGEAADKWSCDIRTAPYTEPR